ncbi:MAG: glutathione S-transferase family protein [Candidatus Binatia bacterium]|nr:glutathione S-transferase family protein [Candidatus Binatia bacterium]
MGLALVFLVPLAAFVVWWLWERSHRKTHAVSPGLQVDINLPHAAEFELYHNALSLCSKKTRFCLAELGIDYVGHHVHLIETGGYENIGRAFLAVNPAGVVPVLVHDGHPIYESHEQIRYAADHAPEGAPSLVPSDPAAEDEMQEWVDRSSLVGDDPIAGAKRSAGNAVPGLTVPLFSSMMEEIPVHWIFEGLLFHRLKIRPVLFLALKSRGLRGLPKLPPAVKAIQACGRAMNTHLDDLEAHLEKSGGPWILGEAFTLADVSWVVVVERLREADSLHVFLGEGRRPAVTAWWERIRARPSYHDAIKAHGEPRVVSGTERLIAAKAADPALRAALEEF